VGSGQRVVTGGKRVRGGDKSPTAMNIESDDHCSVAFVKGGHSNGSPSVYQPITHHPSPVTHHLPKSYNSY
jgi:hypothetical protein